MSKQDVVEQELRRMWDERGRLVPSDVVEAAQDEDSPLHPYFDWSDRAAAQRWREAQAAQLIRSVKLRITTVDAGTVVDHRVRGWLAARSAGDEAPVPAGYFPTTDTTDPRTRAAVLRQFQREWQAFRRRWEHLEDFWRLVDEQRGEPAA